MPIILSTNYRATIKQLKEKRRLLNRAIMQGIDDAATILYAEVRHNVNNVILHRRSNALYNAIARTKVEPIDRGYAAYIRTVPRIPYDWIHEDGGYTGRGHKTLIPARHPYSIALKAVRSNMQNAVSVRIERVMR